MAHGGQSQSTRGGGVSEATWFGEQGELHVVNLVSSTWKEQSVSTCGAVNKVNRPWGTQSESTCGTVNKVS